MDAIAFATGFRATDAPIAQHIYGTAGVSLAEAWGRDMRALRGTLRFRRATRRLDPAEYDLIPAAGT